MKADLRNDGREDPWPPGPGQQGKESKDDGRMSLFQRGTADCPREQSGAGAINRIIDLEVDITLLRTSPMFSRWSARENNGHAGEVFVAHVQSIKDSVLIQRHKEWCSNSPSSRKAQESRSGVGLHPLAMSWRGNVSSRLLTRRRWPACWL